MVRPPKAAFCSHACRRTSRPPPSGARRIRALLLLAPTGTAGPAGHRRPIDVAAQREQFDFSMRLVGGCFMFENLAARRPGAVRAPCNQPPHSASRSVSQPGQWMARIQLLFCVRSSQVRWLRIRSESLAQVMVRRRCVGEQNRKRGSQKFSHIWDIA